jgi:hypothetical protein
MKTPFPNMSHLHRKIDLESGTQYETRRIMALLPIAAEARAPIFKGQKWSPTSPNDGSRHLS